MEVRVRPALSWPAMRWGCWPRAVAVTGADRGVAQPAGDFACGPASPPVMACPCLLQCRAAPSAPELESTALVLPRIVMPGRSGCPQRGQDACARPGACGLAMSRHIDLVRPGSLPQRAGAAHARGRAGPPCPVAAVSTPRRTGFLVRLPVEAAPGAGIPFRRKRDGFPASAIPCGQPPATLGIPHGGSEEDAGSRPLPGQCRAMAQRGQSGLPPFGPGEAWHPRTDRCAAGHGGRPAARVPAGTVPGFPSGTGPPGHPAASSARKLSPVPVGAGSGAAAAANRRFQDTSLGGGPCSWPGLFPRPMPWCGCRCPRRAAARAPLERSRSGACNLKVRLRDSIAT